MIKYLFLLEFIVGDFWFDEGIGYIVSRFGGLVFMLWSYWNLIIEYLICVKWIKI